MNAAVLIDSKARANPVAQCGSTVFGKGHAVARRGGLAAQKRSPVIIKVLEYRRSIDWPDRDVIKTGISKQTFQRLRVAHGKPPAFVKRDGV